MWRKFNTIHEHILDERDLKLSTRSLGSGAVGQVLEGVYKGQPVSAQIICPCSVTVFGIAIASNTVLLWSRACMH